MKKVKILWVDDEYVADQPRPEGNYLWYYRDALEESGYEVVHALGPDAALKALKIGHSRAVNSLVRGGKLFDGSTWQASTLNKIQDLMAAEGKNFVRADGKLTESAVAVLNAYVP